MYTRSPWGFNKPPVGATIDWGDPINTGLLNCWLMNEGAGGYLHDIARRDRATHTNLPTWAGGVHGTSPELNGTSQYYTVSNKDFSQFTLVGWLKRNRTGQSGNVDRIFLSVPVNGWGLYIVSDGGANKDNLALTKVGVSNTTFGTQITDLNWHMFGVDHNGTTAHLILDGTLRNTNSYSATFSGGGNYTIGSRGAGEYFGGRLSAFRFYNRILTVAEYARLYNEPFAGIVTPRRYGMGVEAGGVVTSIHLPLLGVG